RDHLTDRSGQPAAQRRERENRGAGQEHPRVAEDRAETRPGHQEHGVGDRVAGHDELQAGARGVQVPVNRGQPDIDDEHVDDGHQLPGEDDGEQRSRPDPTAGGRRDGAARLAVPGGGAARWLACCRGIGHVASVLRRRCGYREPTYPGTSSTRNRVNAAGRAPIASSTVSSLPRLASARISSPSRPVTLASRRYNVSSIVRTCCSWELSDVALPSKSSRGSDSLNIAFGYARRSVAAASTPSAGPPVWPPAYARTGTRRTSRTPMTVRAAESSAVSPCTSSLIGSLRSASRVSSWAHRLVAASSSRLPCASTIRRSNRRSYTWPGHPERSGHICVAVTSGASGTAGRCGTSGRRGAPGKGGSGGCGVPGGGRPGGGLPGGGN